MLKIFCTETRNLKQNTIKKILSLKNTHWKHSMYSQKKFFEKNVCKRDLHVLLLEKSKLIGYICLRKKKYLYKNKIQKYLHFDTCIIKKSHRKKNYTLTLMNFTNKIIENSSCISILYCKKDLVTFYKKFNWKVVNKRFASNIVHLQEKIIMKYN